MKKLNDDMITIEQAKKILGKTGKKLTDKEIEKLYYGLNSIINQIIDNNFSQLNLCKKQ